jgi:hypothetical protein
MTEILEYFSTAIVLILIVSTTAISLVWVLQPVFRDVARKELSSTAEKLLTHLLGYSGDPAQWGSDLTVNASRLHGIGLAKASHDDAALNIDIDKITRLSHADVGTYIDLKTVRRLMNLDNRFDFNLKFIPALNITIKPTKTISYKNGKVFETEFEIMVITHEKIRVANVNLTSYLLLAYLEKGHGETLVNYTVTAVQRTFTDWKGEASLNYTKLMNDLIDRDLVGTVLMVQGKYYGMKTMAIRQSLTSGDILLATIVGETLILTITPEEIPKGAAHLQQEVVEGTLDSVAESTFEDITDKIKSEAPWIINYGSKNNRVYLLEYMEPDIFFVAFVVKYTGKYWMILALRVPIGEIGNKIPQEAEVANVRRLVLIEGEAYYADLYVWRTSW